MCCLFLHTGNYSFVVDEQPVAPRLLFTNNDTNMPKLEERTDTSKKRFYKDGFHEFIIKGNLFLLHEFNLTLNYYC